MADLQTLADAHQLPINCSSAGALHESLMQLRQGCADRDLVELMVQMATKPMQLALYFCTGEVESRETWEHYALAVPEYTHFTSPIRRYPDVVVHRLLAAALQLRPSLAFSAPSYYAAGQPGVIIPPAAGDAAAAQPQQPGVDVDVEKDDAAVKAVVAQHKLFTTDLTGKVAEHCNDRRLAARNAQDASLKLYLCVLLRRHPVVTQGIVCQLGGDRHMAVYLPAYGMEIRLFMEDYGSLLAANYDAGAKTLLLRANDAGHAGGRGTNRAGSNKTRGDGKPAPNWVHWMHALPEINLQQGAQPVLLPLQVRMFDHVPVVLTSPLRLGQVSQVEGRLLLDPAQLLGAAAPQDLEALQEVQAKVDSAMEAAAATAAAASPTAAPSPPVPPLAALSPEQEVEVAKTPDAFCIPYETMLND